MYKRNDSSGESARLRRVAWLSFLNIRICIQIYHVLAHLRLQDIYVHQRKEAYMNVLYRRVITLLLPGQYYMSTG